MKRFVQSLFIITLASLGPACSTDEAVSTQRPSSLDQSPAPSGFLSNYSQLRPSPLNSSARVYESPKMASYKSFIVDPVRIIPDRTARGRPITTQDSVELGLRARFALIDSLKVNYKVVDKPGPGVARIRTAVTGVAFSSKTGAGKMELGGASAEMEIIDSVSGERLGAATESDVVSASQSAAASKDKLADAEIVFDHWAARLNLWLQRMARGESTFAPAK